jgi:hypothetical protein
VNTPQDLFVEAIRRGLRLESAGDKLAVIPKGKCPPDFADTLREHKRELLDWLETRTNQLTTDQVSWLHISRQILADEFEGADSSTVASVSIGLRSILHPLCQRALERLARGKIQ